MKPVKRIVEQPGTVQAFEETALHARLKGYIATIAIDPDKKDRPAYDRFIDTGSRVKEKQVLARIAIPELDAGVPAEDRVSEASGRGGRAS